MLDKNFSFPERKVTTLLIWIAAAVTSLTYCGKKSEDDRSGTSEAVYVPADWDGVSDYPNARWEFLGTK